MPCLNCDHTIHNLGVHGKRVFWCPRCGSLTDIQSETSQGVESPTLVGLVKEAAMKAKPSGELTFIPMRMWLNICEAAWGKE